MKQVFRNLKNVIYLSVYCAFAFSNAFAQENSVNMTKNQDNRIGKNAMAALSAGVADGMTVGGNLGFFLNYDTIFEFHMAQGSAKKYIGDSEFYALRVRRFFGDLMYASFGMGLRTLTLPGNLIDNDELTNRQSTLGTIQDFGAEVAVGNQWFWANNVTLGFDFIGAYIPFSPVNVDADRKTNLADSDILDEYNKRVAYKVTPRFLRLSIGQVF